MFCMKVPTMAQVSALGKELQSRAKVPGKLCHGVELCACWYFILWLIVLLIYFCSFFQIMSLKSSRLYLWQPIQWHSSQLASWHFRYPVCITFWGFGSWPWYLLPVSARQQKFVSAKPCHDFYYFGRTSIRCTLKRSNKISLSRVQVLCVDTTA